MSDSQQVVKEKIMRERPKGYKWVIVACCILTASSAIYSDSVLIPWAPSLMEAFHLSPQQFAMVATSGLLIPVFISLFVGGVADKFGAKNVVIIGYVISIVCGIMRIFVDSFLPLFLLTFFAALCGAIMNALVAKILAAWMGVSAGRGIGIMVAIVMLAQTVGMSTGALFSSFNMAFIMAAVVATISLIFWIIFMQERPAGTPPLKSESIVRGMGIALKSKNVWFAGLGLMFFMGGNITANKFFTVYLTQDYGDSFSPEGAGLVASMFSLGLLAGNLLFPNITIKIGKQKPILILISVLAAAFLYINYSVGSSAIIYLTTLLAGAFAGGIQPIHMSAVAIMPDIPDNNRGAAGGATATMMMIGGFFIPSYVVTPIVTNADASVNFQLLFILAAVCFLVVTVLAVIAPDLQALVKKSKEQNAS